MGNTGISGWRRYNIFLSSTFKDMDYERDIIKFRVIPSLNRRFRDRRIELQAIDLRLGVNTSDMTEEESERKVLSVCTSCIDSARPFFIGLLGERYGWIPSMERWKEFIAGLDEEEKQILKDTAGCSVTEMEMVYGALSQESFDASHVLFFIRDDSSYEGVPESMLPSFIDSDPGLLEKLSGLKDRVKDIFGKKGGEDDRCTSYHLEWKDGQFSSEMFEELVSEQLAYQIEKESAKEESENGSLWWVEEKELEESTLMKLLPGTIELELQLDDEEDEENENSTDIAVLYYPGYGASTHMAQDYASWEGRSDVVRLLAVFGLSEYSQSVRPVIARWIHELAQVCGEEEIPEDQELLISMPPPDLYAIFGKLVENVREMGKYIYIYMDELETLEMTSAKDLYMPWLARIKDDVNVQVNLQGDSEACKKVLEANPHLVRFWLPVMDSEDTEDLLATFEKSFYLELPASVRQQMKDVADSEDSLLAPLKVHNVFRFFESLTQEDFARIRRTEGSQIEAINSYLENIWGKMPETPYMMLGFMVREILSNLGLDESWENAFWKLCAAPSGLREKDIAWFVGDGWSDVQFYRAMHFLQDFFYEDRKRHLWHVKYLTAPEDGMLEEQQALAEYILSLDERDSLRETMGLYYAIKSGNTSLFSHFTDKDYLHVSTMEDQKRFKGPQIRQLEREGYLSGKDFKDYCMGLDPGERLQLMIHVFSALADLQEERDNIIPRFSDMLKDVKIDKLSAVDSFSYASILAQNRSASLGTMEKAMTGARRSHELGYPDAVKLMRALSNSLTRKYLELGKKDKAGQLAAEIAALPESNADDRFMALQPLLAQAGAKGLMVNRKKAGEAMDRFLEGFYDILDSLEPTWDNVLIIFKRSMMIIQALDILHKKKEYDRMLAEAIRFMPFMELFYTKDGFFSQSSTLELFSIYYFYIWMATTDLGASPDAFGKGEGSPLQEIFVLSLTALTEGLRKLNEADPDNRMINMLRSHTGKFQELAEALRKEWNIEDISAKGVIEGLDKEILENYALYTSEKE